MDRKLKIKILFFLLFYLFITQNYFAQWVSTQSTGAEWCYCFTTTTVAVNNQVTNYQYAGTDKGVFISTNYGSEWTKFTTGLTDLNVLSLVPLGNTMFAGGYGGVFRSTNLGVSWSNVSSYQSGFTYPIVSSMVVLGPNILAGTGSGVFKSTNNGTNWKKVNTGLADSSVSVLLPFDYQGTVYIYAGVSGGVYLTPNYGANWYPVKTGFTAGANVSSLAVKKTGNSIELYAATSTGLYKSVNMGTNWFQINNGLLYPVNCLAVSGANVFAGTSYGVYRSTDSGSTWVSIGMTGTGNTYIKSLAVLGQYLMAGTYQGGIWRMYLPEIGVAVDKPSTQIPKEFEIKQNYPNPFNPVTTIQYTVVEAPHPATSVGLPGQVMASLPHVKLKVYDLLGREIATLVNEVKPAGVYSVQFNANELPSGIYIYKIQIGEWSLSKKMVLLK